MLPITCVPEIIAKGMESFRKVFCRAEGFEHVCRFITGLILSPNKTLQGIYDALVWEERVPSRRAMHEAVFESGWDSAALIRCHRTEVAQAYQGRGRQVISLDWTLTHHERGPKIYAVTKSYDYVERRMALFQTVVTAVVSNRDWDDGLEMVVQDPRDLKAEAEYLRATAKTEYTQMAEAHQRLLELLHYRAPQLGYRKRTEIAVEIGRQLEAEGQFPQAPYAFDNGVLTLELTRLIESSGKHWVSELEVARHIQWQGRWRRVDEVAAELRQQHPESFRSMKVSCRNGEEKCFWAFTKVVRLKRYGRKRLVIVHEQPDLSDAPRFLLTDALHWESRRVIQTWSYRLGLRGLSRVRQAGMWLGVSSGTQGGSGHPPLPLELRSAVISPTRTCRRVEIRKICVCRGEENLRSEVQSDLPGGITLPAGTMQAVFCRGQILR
jgi:hypothetical protein